MATLLGARGGAGAVALVPTMGALHEGHASLMGLARERAGAEGTVVVSIFVNPLQFGPGEDLDRYPRTFDADLAVCERQGVDVVFAPAADEVYPGGEPQVTVEPGPLGTLLEGASRPGHFRGVLTVVAKLLGLVRPDVAIFGQKDYQQLALITRMASDLCLGVEIVGAETVRELDGLALSSRNRYLDAEQRERATALSRALYAARDAGPRGLAEALAAGRAVLSEAEGVELDYFEIRAVDLGELAAAVPPQTPARAVVAARVGTTRLIDNMPLVIGTAAAEGSS
nr:pantoate--beta-alanine ligase [Nocardioides thalensis]